MNTLKLMQHQNLANKKVILRVDFNVPVFEGKITDNTRMVKIIPTIEFLIKQQAKIIIISHFGRPQGKPHPEMSLAIVAKELSRLLNRKVKFIPQLAALAKEEKITAGEVMLLENLRFYAAEEANDQHFAKELASLGEVYINDAFSCAHRAHASITSLATLLPSSAGLLMQEELKHLNQIFNSKAQDLAAIVGGAKISSKIKLIESLMQKAKLLVIGGAMANTFLKVIGHEVGKSLYEEEALELAAKLLQQSRDYQCQLILPLDVVTINAAGKINMLKVGELTEDMCILDVGDETLSLIAQQLTSMKILLWNGPLGMIEKKPFDLSTNYLARKIACLTNAQKLTSVAGGGDIVGALTAANLADDFSYISTAGGAFLEWLEGGDLCGIRVLCQA
jgi:phosphoglycerate kinase